MANSIKAKRTETEVVFMVYNRETKDNEKHVQILDGKISDSKALSEAKKEVKEMNKDRNKKTLLVLIDVIEKHEKVTVYEMEKTEFFKYAKRIDD